MLISINDILTFIYNYIKRRLELTEININLSHYSFSKTNLFLFKKYFNYKIHVRNLFTYIFGYLLFCKLGSFVDHTEQPSKSDPPASASLKLPPYLAQEF